MAITISQNEFLVGDVLVQGLTDTAGAAEASIGEIKVAIVDGSFEFTIPSMVEGTYTLPISILDVDGTEIDVETFTITVAAESAPTEPEPTEPTPVENPTEEAAMSTEAQALIDLNKSTIQTFVPKYEVSRETDTAHVVVYPGSQTGFAPLTASAHSATSADEFKVMSDEALLANPSAGFTGGRGTGNDNDFGRYPYRALMTEVRGEFFPKLGDFDPKTTTQYPLGRTGDLLENATIPEGFTAKDSKGYATTTTRGGVDASPIPTSGFTF